MLFLQNLMVMQADLRHWDTFDKMISFVKNGGRWTPETLVDYARTSNLSRTSPVIQISCFDDDDDDDDDDDLYIHDGHHRCVATWLGGRDCLYEGEYEIHHWTYESYLEINHKNGWYTPFDPRVHVRTADFGKFKLEAKDRFSTDPVGAEKWVMENVSQFRRKRVYGTLPEFADAIYHRFAKKVEHERV